MLGCCWSEILQLGWWARHKPLQLENIQVCMFMSIPDVILPALQAYHISCVPLTELA